MALMMTYVWCEASENEPACSRSVGFG